MNVAQPKLAADVETVVEVTYVSIKKLGKGAFGEAVLYRKIEVISIEEVSHQYAKAKTAIRHAYYAITSCRPTDISNIVVS